MCSGRTVLFSVLAPGLMKHLSVPGTRIETWPNMPMVPCRPSIRVSVAVLARNVASSVMAISSEKGLQRFSGASALDQRAPARDLRGEKFLDLIRRRTFL